jgi:hypothetical protein
VPEVLDGEGGGQWRYGPFDSTCPLSSERVALDWARWWSGVKSYGGVAGAGAGEVAPVRRLYYTMSAPKMASDETNWSLPILRTL